MVVLIKEDKEEDIKKGQNLVNEGMLVTNGRYMIVSSCRSKQTSNEFKFSSLDLDTGLWKTKEHKDNKGSLRKFILGTTA